jgi:hypothetical protein
VSSLRGPEHDGDQRQGATEIVGRQQPQCAFGSEAHTVRPSIRDDDRGGVQRFKERSAIDAMLAACVVNRVEARDRTPDASHLEVEKDPDRRRMRIHHVVDQRAKANGH